LVLDWGDLVLASPIERSRESLGHGLVSSSLRGDSVGETRDGESLSWGRGLVHEVEETELLDGEIRETVGSKDGFWGLLGVDGNAFKGGFVVGKTTRIFQRTVLFVVLDHPFVELVGEFSVRVHLDT